MSKVESQKSKVVVTIDFELIFEQKNSSQKTLSQQL